MIQRIDELLRALLRSLPLTLLLGVVLSAILKPFGDWIALLHARIPIPPGPVLTDYLAIRAVVGVCGGAAIYAAGWPPRGWLRICLLCISYFVLAGGGGDMDDFARWSLGHWLEIWLVGSLFMGVIIGTLIYALERRQRARQAANPQPDDAL